MIKVIGIGGGGVDMVDYMYDMGIHGVDFAVCNTDMLSFDGVNVPVKVHFGQSGREAKSEFEANADKFEELLTDNTRMVFIVAGMGGSTGSDVAPLLAKMAKSMGILTVGIVTTPFLSEQNPRIIRTLPAVEEMSRNVDSLIIINIERLRLLFPDLFVDECFIKVNKKAYKTVKSIAELITQRGIINLDFYDINATMQDSGVTLVSYGFGKGENRIDMAIRETLNMPLLNNYDLYNAKRMLFYLSFKPESHVTMEEIQQSVERFVDIFDKHIRLIWGCGYDTSLMEEQEVKFTLIATGFGIEDF